MRVGHLVPAIAAAMLSGSAAFGAGNPNAVVGLVSDQCTACHVIPGLKPRFERADVNAPPFQTIAERPDLYPEDQIRSFLQRPHFPMGKFILSPSDIENLIAFIQSLKTTP